MEKKKRRRGWCCRGWTKKKLAGARWGGGEGGDGGKKKGMGDADRGRVAPGGPLGVVPLAHRPDSDWQSSLSFAARRVPGCGGMSSRLARGSVLAVLRSLHDCFTVKCLCSTNSTQQWARLHQCSHAFIPKHMRRGYSGQSSFTRSGEIALSCRVVPILSKQGVPEALSGGLFLELRLRAGVSLSRSSLVTVHNVCLLYIDNVCLALTYSAVYLHSLTNSTRPLPQAVAATLTRGRGADIGRAKRGSVDFLVLRVQEPAINGSPSLRNHGP